MPDNLLEEELDEKNDADEESNHQDEEEWEEEDLETLKSKTERYKQQINWSKEENIRLRNMLIESEVWRVKEDSQRLLDLYKQDPKLAKKVAEKFDFTQTEFWSFDWFIKSWWVNKKQSSSLDEETFEKLYNQRRQKEEHEESLNEVKKVLKDWIKNDNLRKEAEEYFNEITEWKILTKSKAKKFAETAILYVMKDQKKSDTISNFWAIWAWSSSSKWDWEAWYYIDWKTNKLVLDNNKKK